MFKKSIIMKTKAITGVLFTLFLFTVEARSQNGNQITDLILSSYSARNFTSDTVTDHDINLIIRCGIKAPSSRNGQPWKFTVVKDTALMRKAIGTINPGNALILVSGPESQEGPGIYFDCALATENMNIAAQSLGLGARIYGGPVGNVNANMKYLLEIPEGYRVVTILRIGHIEKNVDAVSSASARKSFEDLINYKK